MINTPRTHIASCKSPSIKLNQASAVTEQLSTVSEKAKDFGWTHTFKQGCLLREHHRLTTFSMLP